jgi:hypothetical protein
MDSRLLYSATETLKNKLTWIPINGEEWLHFGTDLREPFSVIKGYIDKHLGLQDVYIVTNRTESRKLNDKEIENVINEIAGKENFLLWDIDLTKAIDFNKIGILRQGILKNKLS